MLDDLVGYLVSMKDTYVSFVFTYHDLLENVL